MPLCVICGAPARAGSRGPPSSLCVEHWRERDRQRTRAWQLAHGYRKQKRPRSVAIARVCDLCGEPFIARYGKQRFCTPEHWLLHRWMKVQARRPHLAPRVCKLCGTSFVPFRNGAQHSTCCPEHARAYKLVRDRHHGRLYHRRHRQRDNARKRVRCRIERERARALWFWAWHKPQPNAWEKRQRQIEAGRRYRQQPGYYDKQRARRRAWEARPENRAAKRVRDKLYRQTHRVERAASARASLARHPQTRARRNARARERRQAIPLAVRRAKSRAWYLANAVQVCANNGRYRRHLKIDRPEHYRAIRKAQKIRRTAKDRVLRELGIPPAQRELYRQALNLILHEARHELGLPPS